MNRRNTGRNPAQEPAARGPARDYRPPEYSDEALALGFAARYASSLRYVDQWGRWYRWTGEKWRSDDDLFAIACARAYCREVAAGCRTLGIAKGIASAKTIAAVQKLARADRRLAAIPEQWDQDPWLLNTPAGVVNLRTGGIRPHDPLDYMTKITAVGPGGEWEAWHQFLAEVTDGDEELQGFLQRMAGYSLTGDTSAHALFFLFGTGANGKSVFIDTQANILGDYHSTAPIETFTVSYSDRHPTELAGLRGARLVTATETEEGRRWAEARIKQLTGGDKIAARFMRQDFFEFTPQFKLVIAGNHKPGLRSVDEAVRRRFHLVPFAVTIPSELRDPFLKEKLKAEWPGILAWMIRGCLKWQEKGLAPPEAVSAATAAYLEAEDALAAWMEECCEAVPDNWESSADLFGSWKIWAEQAGEHAGSAKRFGQLVEARGIQSHRKNSGRGFVGLLLKREVRPHWSETT
jgi:putative DNA primase/helicase